MKILFVGGTGNISSACTRLAVERAHEVFLLNRGRTVQPASVRGAKVLAADVRDPEAYARAVAGQRFDAVVQFLAFQPQHVEADLEVLRDRTDQYVMISTASAYQKPPAHYLVRESTPLRNPYWEYSRRKIECELRLMRAYREEGFPVTVVRPSYTYGESWVPSAVGGHDYTVVNRMRQGKKVIVHGDGQSLWTMTHNSDFARGLLGLLGNTQAVGQSYHITSDEVLTWDQIYRIIARAAGAEPRLVHVPSDLIAALAPEWGCGLLGDKACSAVFDNSKIKEAVPGFQATVSFAEGMRRSLAWLNEDERRRRIDPGADALMDRILAAYEPVLAAAGGQAAGSSAAGR